MNLAFAAKRINGHDLELREHGAGDAVEIPAGTSHNFNLPIPYAKCALTGIEIIGANNHDKAELRVMFGEVVVNQFGFAVNLSSGRYIKTSPYNAELSNTLVVRITITNKSEVATRYSCNITLHEMKP